MSFGLGSVGAGLAGVGMFMGGGLPATLALGAQFGQGLFNSYMNYRNYQLQRDEYTYDKGLQEQMMWRDDNAVLRRTIDMRNAGINPVLAAGQGASAGPVISTSAPQMGRIETGMLESAQAVMQMMSMQSQIAKTQAEEKFLNQQVIKSQAETDMTRQMTREKAWNLKQATDMGVRTNPSGAAGNLLDFISILKNNLVRKSETPSPSKQELKQIQNQNMQDYKTKGATPWWQKK